MPIARTYDAGRNTISVTIQDAYRDRVSRKSDIQEYLPFLFEETVIRENPVVVELGTRKGNSTLAFLAGGAEVWSVDIEDIRLDPEGMMPWARFPKWHFIHGSSLDAGTVKKLPQGIDIFFNDASHEYQATLDECRIYIPMLKPGGIALFHDTNLLRYDQHEGLPYVREALDQYCAETGRTWENLPGEYGMGIIRG